MVELAHQWRRTLKYSAITDAEDTKEFRGVLDFIKYARKEGCIIYPPVEPISPKNYLVDNIEE
jgi:hypothetical protein